MIFDLDVLQKEQNAVARLCKINPKKFWKYVNSKSNSKDKIGALKYRDEQGNMMTPDTPTAKAEALVMVMHFSVVLLVTSRLTILSLSQ